MTLRQLHQHYRRFNKRYFGGRLPAEIGMTFEDMSKSDGGGLCTTYQEPGLTIHTLHFDKRFQDCDRHLLFALLHEQAHIAVYPNERVPHDAVFQKEMQWLAVMGAFRDLW